MHILKKPAKTILALILLISTTGTIFAFSFNSADQQGFDKGLLASEQIQYSNPNKIYVTQVTTSAGTLSRNPELWVKSIYYYSVTRLLLPNVPYTYFLDESGIIYQGNEGVGVNPQLSNEISGAVIIGYLSNNPTLTSRAKESLSEIVEDISFKWGISNLQAVNLLLNKQEGGITIVTVEEIDGEFKNSVLESLTGWKGYTQENLDYKVKIEEITYEKEVEIGERLSVTVTATNISDFPWFTDIDPIYLSVKGSVESPFAVNQEWESFSRPASISAGVILPGEKFEFVFNMEGKYLLGEASEEFEILKFKEKPFEDSNFTLTFNITGGEKELVEVSSVKYGFVNIRECRWYSCEIMDSADNGAVLILEGEEAGWSRVRFGTDLYGWVNSAYLKKI